MCGSMASGVGRRRLVFGSPLFRRSIRGKVSGSAVGRRRLVFIRSVARRAMIGSVSSSVSRTVPWAGA